MIISEHHKYIFLAVPETGAASVERCLLEHDATAVQNRVRVSGHDVEVGTHITALELSRVLGDRYHDYKSFAFVRHPHARRVSSYCFYRDGRAATKVQRGERGGVLRLKAYAAQILPCALWSLLYPLRSCREFLVAENNNLLINRVGYFENFEEDLRHILACVGVDVYPAALPHLNRSAHDYTRSYVSETLERLLAPSVRDDLAAFYAHRQRAGRVGTPRRIAG